MDILLVPALVYTSEKWTGTVWGKLSESPWASALVSQSARSTSIATLEATTTSL